LDRRVHRLAADARVTTKDIIDSNAGFAGILIIMPTITIRDLDDEVKSKLRVRAARHGRSMEAEVRDILRRAVDERPLPDDLGTRVRQRFAAVRGVELDLPSRTDAPRAADIA
jgi:antitoxin FitA